MPGYTQQSERLILLKMYMMLGKELLFCLFFITLLFYYYHLGERGEGGGSLVVFLLPPSTGWIAGQILALHLIPLLCFPLKYSSCLFHLQNTVHNVCTFFTFTFTYIHIHYFIHETKCIHIHEHQKLCKLIQMSFIGY